MTVQLNLPLRIYEDLIRVSEELSLMAKKPISPSMTINLLMEVYRAHLNNPCALDAFSIQLQTANIMTPQEFDHYWDESSKSAPNKNNKKRLTQPILRGHPIKKEEKK